MLFERHNASDFVSVVTELAADSDLRKGIGSQAQHYVLAERTWESNAKKVLSVFKSFY
jgi:glycosyltransferase involved in cell wall biosynthesis